MSRIIIGLFIPAALVTSAAVTVAQTWQTMAPVPGVGRHHPVTFALDGYGYVATGSTTSLAATDDFYRYDPVANSWETLPDFPGPDRGYSYGGSYAGKGYLGFGRNGGYFSDLWEYNPVTEAWTQLASLPGQARSHPAFLITDDGKIYVGCGSSAIGNLGDWWEYDIAGNSWVQHDDLPGPNRHHPYYFNIGDVPYIGFGHGSGIYKDFYRFDPVTDTWTRMTDFPGEARVAGTQFTYDGHGYVLSGEGVDHQQFATGELWKYDGDADMWTELAAHPGSGRWAPGTFLVDDSLYFLAGLSTTRLENDMMTTNLADVVGVDTPHTSGLPAVALAAPRPNPFTAQTAIQFELGVSGDVSVHVFDATGRSVRSLLTGNRAAGPNSILWDGRSTDGSKVSPGVYFVRLTTSVGTASRRVTLLP